MTEASTTDERAAYAALLDEYCRTGSEDALYRAGLLSQSFIAANILPDEIVALHTEAVQQLVRPYDPRSLVATQQMLLEVMIAYGVRYSEYAEFKLAEAKRMIESEQDRVRIAEQSEQERLELLAVISHELGTPLTVAKANMAAIRRFLSENRRLSQELANRAIDAETAIERLLTLREELVEATERRPHEVVLAPLNVHSAIQRAVKWAEPSALEKQVKLSWTQGARAALIEGDPDALQSVFGNLLSNAVRYTPPGGSVTVKTYNEPGCVCVEVADTGIGMTEEARAHLFERFYRAPEARRVATWGLGLGLAIANELATLMHARIEVASTPGGGSSLTVIFPQARAQE